jgi:hypothetical protein
MDKFPILEIVPALNPGGIYKPSDLSVKKPQKAYDIQNINDSKKSKTNPFESKDTFERSDKKNIKPEEDKAVTLKDFAMGLAESIPYVRRFVGVENSASNGDYVKTALAGAILLANVPEDFRDLKIAKDQLLHPEMFKNAPVGREFQPAFSFLRGTWFEFLLKGQGKYTSRISKFLYDNDKALFNNDFFRQSILKIKDGDYIEAATSRIDCANEAVKAYQITNKSILKKVLGHASARVTVYGIIAFALLEAPSIFKAFTSSDNLVQNLKNGFKQSVKSFVNVVSVIGWSAVMGWILHRYKGPAGSLLGIGLGTVMGSKQAQIINDNIDNFKI